jgi:hypothetical protein
VIIHNVHKVIGQNNETRGKTKLDIFRLISPSSRVYNIPSHKPGHTKSDRVIDQTVSPNI